jgi:MFS family permease
MQARQENVFVVALRVLREQPMLAVMMFLQYAIWGAWAVGLSGYLDKMGYTGKAVSLIYNAIPIMSLIVPFTAGQIADRFMPAQRALALFHLLGGFLLLALAYQKSLLPMVVLMLGYGFFYAPTLALSNSVAFRNLRNPEVEFGPIRVWGTIGWIVANFIVSFLRTRYQSDQWATIDLFVLAGVLSLLMAVACLALPHTPPATEASDPLAFREALVLLRDRNYAIFFVIAMIVATELPPLLSADLPLSPDSGHSGGHHGQDPERLDEHRADCRDFHDCAVVAGGAAGVGCAPVDVAGYFCLAGALCGVCPGVGVPSTGAVGGLAGDCCACPARLLLCVLLRGGVYLHRYGGAARHSRLGAVPH